MEFRNVYRESLPALRLIGKRYTDADRGPLGGFGMTWIEWFDRKYDQPLLPLGLLPQAQDVHIGCMKLLDGGLEYWTGMFFPEGTPCPDGYQYADIPAGDIGVCWLYGSSRNGELYGEHVHHQCVKELSQRGWGIAKNSWFFECFHKQRFYEPDEAGKIILDYCIYLGKHP